MLTDVFVATLGEFSTRERAPRDEEAVALTTVTPPVAILHDLCARFAAKVYDLELVPQVSIHDLGVEAIALARGAAAVLLEPLLQTVVVEDLLAVVALHVLFLHDVEANGAEEGVNELLVRFKGVFFGELVIAAQLEHVVVGCLVDGGDEVSRFLLLVLFEPSERLEGALVMRCRLSSCDIIITVVIVICRDHFTSSF